MTVSEIAKKHDITVQAVYKKLKKAGINLASLKDASGKLTEEGARKILDLLHPEPPPGADPEELNRLKTEVEKLKNSCNQLSTQVEMLTAERDFLRTALEREQALHGLTLQKLALPPAESERGLKGRFKSFMNRFKEKEGADHGN